MQGSQTIKSHASLKSESVWFKTKLISQFLTLSFLLTQPFYLSYLQAAPIGGDVVGGAGSISQSDLTTTINQTSQNLAIDWQSFDVNANEQVKFIQPSSSSIALNRIIGNNGSTIQGQINANGQVILVNPNGVFFTTTATINVGGLVASSLDMTPSDFMNGNFIFNEVLGADGAVINSGIINASLGGNVALIGKQVKNDGLISAELGSVVLAAGKQSVLTFDNQGLIGVKVAKEVLQEELGLEEAIVNNGEINAAGGRVLLTASTSQDVFSQAVNTNQLDQASSVVVHADGSFTLGGGADVLNTGSIDVSSESNTDNTARIVLLGENIISSGSIKADTNNGQAGEIEIHANNKTLLIENSVTSAVSIATGKGGLIKVLGDKVGLFEQSIINASGANGGGEVLFGGDRQGLNPLVRNANFIYLGENTSINADATDSGDGGKIITFAKDTARIHGNLFARGGFNSGNGGFIETSGLRGFEITNAPDVSAVNGSGGLWLIDPFNIKIVNAGTTVDVTESPTRTFTSTANTAELLVSVLESGLANGNVKVVTGLGGVATDGNIIFDATLDFDQGNSQSDRRLTLEARNDIIFTKNATIFDSDRSTSNSRKKLDIRLLADSDGDVNGGDILFSSTLFNPTLPTQPFGINTHGGDFEIRSAINFSSYIDPSMVTHSGVINTSGGDFIVRQATNFNSSNMDIDVGSGELDLDDGGGDQGVNGSVTLGTITANNLISTKAANIIQSTSSILTIASMADLDVTSISGTQLITLTNTANDFNSIKLKGKIVKIADVDSIDIDDSTITDRFEVTAGTVGDTTSNITNSGAVTVLNSGAGTAIFSAGGDITFNGSNDDFDQVNFKNAIDVDVIDISDGIAIAANSAPDLGGIIGDLTLTAKNGDITSFGEINAGTLFTTDTTDITVDDGRSILLDNAKNTFGSAITFQVPDFGNGDRIDNLTFTTDNALRLTDVEITGDLAVIADSIRFRNTTVGGTLTATATATNTTAGDITQISGVLDISGVSTFDATRDVLLGSNNNFRNTVSVAKARNVTFADITGIELGKITTSGNLNVTSDSDTSDDGGEDITQLTTTGNSISVAGTTTFTANNQDISLTNSENNFDSTNSGAITGALIIISADEADITDVNSLIFGNVNIDRGSRTSTFISGAGGTGGNITQVTGTSFNNDNNASTITRFDTNGGSLTLTNLSNDIRVLDILNTATASFTDRDFINLSNVAVTGDLTLNAGNSRTSAANHIRDEANATVSIGGTLNLISRAGTTNSHILLDSTNNNFNTVNIINAQNVEIVDSTASVGIQGSVSGNLKLTSNGSSASNVITNPAALVVSGTAEFLARSGQSINLNHSLNNFSNDPVFTKIGTGNLNNVTVSDISSLTLQDDLNIDGNLTVTSTISNVRLRDTQVGGNLIASANTVLDQAGGKRIIASGTSTLNANTIDLTKNNNNFIGAVNVNNISASVNIKDDLGGIILGDSGNAFVSNNLNIVSTSGSISQGNSIATGSATFNSSDAINLDNSTNDFTGLVNLTAANDAIISDVNALSIESSDSRDLRVTTGGDLNFGSASATTIKTSNDLIVSASGRVNQTTTSTLDISRNAQISAIAGAITQNIKLDSVTNKFNLVDIQNARRVDLFDSESSIDIQGNNITGSLDLITTGISLGDVITNSGELNVTDQAVFTIAANQSVNLNNAANTFGNDVRVNGVINNLSIADTSALLLQNNLITAGDLTLNAQSLTFRQTSVGGNLDATSSTGSIAQTGLTDLSVTGTSNLNGGQGGIVLTRSNNNFGDVVTLLTTSSNPITNPSNVSIRDRDSITLGLSNIEGNLTVNANSINQVDVPAVQDGITVTNTASFIALSGNDITLNNPDNNFNIVSFSSGSGRLRNVSINNSGDLNLSSISVTNDLTATSGGDITNSGALVVDNLLTVSGRNITLGNISNNFNDVTISATNDAAIVDRNNVNFVGVSTIQNNLTVTAGQNITDDSTSSINVTSGIATLNSGSAQSNTVILDSLTHDFNEVRFISGGDVIVNDINGIDLGISNVSGNLTVVADSDLSGGTNNITNNGGALTIGGNLDATTTAGSDILLTNINNSLSGELTLTGVSASRLGNVSIVNTNQSTLNNVTVTNLDVTSAGNIQQTATSVIDVANDSTFDSTTSDISLNNGLNDFSVLNVTNDKDVTLTDKNSLTIGSINATGAVTINSNGLGLGGISANTIILNSGTSNITDNNGGNTNIISNGSVTLTATGGIGNGDPLELAMNGPNAKLIATNNGSGNIEFINNGAIQLETIKNNAVGGTFELKNTGGDVTINSLIIDKSNATSIATFDVTSGNVLGIQPPNIDSNGNRVHVTANTAIFQMNNNSGSVGQLGAPLVTDVPNKIEVISASGTFIKFFGGVPPKDFIGDNAYKNRALQAIESLSGQQLIQVESLAEIDPAIFTDVRNYSHSDIALMMPSDQRYTDDEEEDQEAKEKRQKFLNSNP